ELPAAARSDGISAPVRSGLASITITLSETFKAVVCGIRSPTISCASCSPNRFGTCARRKARRFSMPSLTEWKVPPAFQPRPGDFSFDLDKTLSSVVGLHSIIPPDAFSAETLGTERAGNGVLIEDGLVLTIGYLITEAEAVWLHLGDGRVVQGHALGVDQESGFGLVQALGSVDIEPLPLGSSE